MRSILVFALSAGMFLIGDILLNDPLRIGLAAFMGSVALLGFHLIRLALAFWFYHNETLDTAMISRRQCPSCLCRESLEVTSDEIATDPTGREYRCVVLACFACDETYMVEAFLKETDNG